MKKLILVCVLFCFLLSACGTNQPDADGSGDAAPPSDDQTDAADTDESRDSGEIHDLSDLLFERDAVKEVFFRLTSTFGDAYVGTTEAERNEILDRIFGADLSEFVDVDEEETYSGAIQTFLVLRTDEGDYSVEILSGKSALQTDGGEDVQYLRINRSFIPVLDEDPGFYLEHVNDVIVKKGPMDAFAYMDLHQLEEDICTDTENPDYCAVVTVESLGYESSATRRGSALAKRILDRTLARSELKEGSADATYDIEVRIGETLYGISYETKEFFREELGEWQYSTIGDSFVDISTYLGGFPSPTPAA